MHRELEYLNEMRALGKAPVIGIASDNIELGRIQGRQMATLMPEGGIALYIEGSSMSSTAHKRRQGMLETKPENIQLRTMHSGWSRHPVAEMMANWWKLSTSRQVRYGLLAAQTDTIAAGARDGLQQASSPSEWEYWRHVPFLGLDGCPNSGQLWVNQHTLTATVVSHLLAGQAMELLHRARNGEHVPETTMLIPESYPALEKLHPLAVPVG